MNKIIGNTTIDVDINTTSSETIKKIAAILMKNETIQQSGSDLEGLVVAIEYIVGKELVNKEGKFTKRLKKFVKSYFNINLPNEVLAKIGSLVGTIERRTYTIEIKPPPFDWTPGDFGDYNSCFWCDKEIHRKILENCGYAYAVLFYKNNEKYGRIWLVDLGKYKVAFNPYSIDNSLSLEIAGLVLSKAFNSKYKTISIQSCIYINQNKGIALYTDKEPMSTIDLSFGIVCDYCKEKALTEIHKYDTMLVCDDCYDELIIDCIICGKEIEKRNSTTVMIKNALGHYYEATCCYECLYKHCEFCLYCGEKFKKEEMWPVNVVNIFEETIANYVCSSCLVKYCDVCKECYTLWGTGKAKNFKRPFLCPVCKDKNKQIRKEE